MNESIKVWLSIVSQIHYETNGFKLDLYKATDKQILEIKPVDQAIIDLAPEALKCVHPAVLSNMKNCVFYLTELRAMQGEAWQARTDRWEDEDKRLAAAIERLESKKTST